MYLELPLKILKMMNCKAHLALGAQVMGFGSRMCLVNSLS